MFKYKAAANPHDSLLTFSVGELPGQVVGATSLILSND